MRRVFVVVTIVSLLFYLKIPCVQFFTNSFLFFCFASQSHPNQNQILCDLHFADVALMECSDFMQQLRSFKPQSLGCAVARRKSSTTLIFPLPPQACSGKWGGGFLRGIKAPGFHFIVYLLCILEIGIERILNHVQVHSGKMCVINYFLHSFFRKKFWKFKTQIFHSAI